MQLFIKNFVIPYCFEEAESIWLTWKPLQEIPENQILQNLLSVNPQSITQELPIFHKPTASMSIFMQKMRSKKFLRNPCIYNTLSNYNLGWNESLNSLSVIKWQCVCKKTLCTPPLPPFWLEYERTYG